LPREVRVALMALQQSRLFSPIVQKMWQTPNRNKP